MYLHLPYISIDILFRRLFIVHENPSAHEIKLKKKGGVMKHSLSVYLKSDREHEPAFPEGI